MREWFSQNAELIKTALIAAAAILIGIKLLKSFGKLAKFAAKVIIVAAIIILIYSLYKRYFLP